MLLLLVLLVLDVSPGMTCEKDVILIRNGSDTVCNGTMIQHICVASPTIGVQWIVEIENNTVADIPIQVTSNLGVVNSSSDNVIVNLVQLMPFIVTTLTVTVFADSNVTCTSTDHISRNSSITIIKTKSDASAPGMPSEIFGVGDFKREIKIIEYEASEGTDIDHYLVECVDDKCDQIIAEGTFASLRASIKCFNVCVCPVDRCGNEGPKTCNDLCFETEKEIVGTIGAAATIWILFLILAIILGIYICNIKRKPVQGTDTVKYNKSSASNEEKVQLQDKKI